MCLFPIQGNAVRSILYEPRQFDRFLQFCAPRLNPELFPPVGSQNVSITSPKSTPKKLVSTIRSLSFKKKNELQEDGGQPQQDDEEDDYQNLETAYVAHVCLTWEALHCQYMQLKEKISSQPEDPAFYSFATQEFQQFQVLLQRFIENEPFERGSRVEIYAQARHAMPKLLQVPCLRGPGTSHLSSPLAGS